MGKKHSKKQAPAAPQGLANNPFAALAPLKESLPSAPVVETAPATSDKPAAIKGKVVLQREKKGRGGKTVIRVTGLPEGELGTLAKELKKSLGCGAQVEGQDLLVLGNMSERVAAFFEAKGAKRVVIGN